MPIFKCPDCKNIVSTEAESCPKCGRKVTSLDVENNTKKKPSKIIYIVAGIVIIGIVSMLAGDNSEKNHSNTEPKTSTSSVVAENNQTKPAQESQRYLDAWAILNQGKQKEALAALRKASNEGDFDSTAALGICYLKGFGTKTDIKQGLELLKKGADAGSHFGLSNLGYIYLYGKYGVPKNIDRGVEYIEKGMKANSPIAFVYMGDAYYNGTFGEKNNDKALDMYERAALLGDKLGAKYARDLKNPPDYKLSAPDFVAEYEANEVAADKKYKGKIVRISGKVGDIKKTGIGDDMYVTFKMPSAYAVRSVSCNFTGEHVDDLANLRQGDHIVIQGTVNQLMLNVQVEDCWIVE